jgi:dienelactone hydrolase
VESVAITPVADRSVTLVTCRFARMTLVAKVVFDANARVAGLGVIPAEAAAPWQPPAYAHPESFVEREVTVSLGFGGPELPGILTLPKGAGPFPAAVLVHGSGPNDADESIGGNKVFKDLAWGLASQGVAVLRYVKRSRYAPAGIVGVKEEVLDAARAAIEVCRTTPEIDPQRVVVIGHSQGGELGPRIAAENPAVAGLVVLAGNTRPLQDVALDQFKYLAKLHPESPEVQQSVVLAEAFKQRVDDPGLRPDDAVSFPGSAPIPGAYFLSMRGYQAAEVAAKLPIPVLVLQGDRDYQVTAPDLAGWKSALAGKPNATIKQYPACNHLFIVGSGESTPEEYLAPRHVDEEVVRDIAVFVSGVPSR